MKLLFLTPQLPYPAHQGTTIRNFNIIRNLAPRHDITLLSFGTRAELDAAGPLRLLCRRIEIVPYPIRSMLNRAWTTVSSPLPDMALRLRSAAMHAKFNALFQTALEKGDNFDVIQVEGIEMARYVLNSQARPGAPQSAVAGPNGRPGNPPFVFDDHNAEYVLQRTAFESDLGRPARWHAALYSWIQWHKLAAYEKEVCARASSIVACSTTDADALRQLFERNPAIRSPKSLRDAAQTEILVIPNGVDTLHFCPSDDAGSGAGIEPGLVFTGKMDFRPNIDAMTWFCGDILPRIRAEFPRAALAVVGQKPAPRISALGHLPGVRITGEVPDTRPYIAGAAVYVVPLRMGSGTRLKVLEAMAMGKAIVSTPRGVEGIAVVPDRDVVIADSPETFARAVVMLLRDPERRRALGAAARRAVETSYDWRQIVPSFEQVYGQVTAHTG